MQNPLQNMHSVKLFLPWARNHIKPIKSQAITQNHKQQTVKFQFPPELRDLSGTILFYRPSDISKDFEVPVETDEENALVVKTNGLVPGLWRIKVNWAAGGQAFYKEEIITI